MTSGRNSPTKGVLGSASPTRSREAADKFHNTSVPLQIEADAVYIPQHKLQGQLQRPHDIYRIAERFIASLGKATQPPHTESLTLYPVEDSRC